MSAYAISPFCADSKTAFGSPWRWESSGRGRAVEADAANQGRVLSYEVHGDDDCRQRQESVHRGEAVPWRAGLRRKPEKHQDQREAQEQRSVALRGEHPKPGRINEARGEERRQPVRGLTVEPLQRARACHRLTSGDVAEEISETVSPVVYRVRCLTRRSWWRRAHERAGLTGLGDSLGYRPRFPPNSVERPGAAGPSAPAAPDPASCP